MIKQPIEEWWQRTVISAGILIALGAAYNWLHLTIFQLSSNKFNLLLDAVPQWWATLIYTELIALDIIVAPLSGQWISLAVPFSKGIWLGAAVIICGMLVGHSVAFLLSRVCWQPLTKHIIPAHRYTSYSKKLQHIQFELIILYALPLFPSEAMTWVMGATNFSWKRFAVTLLIGTAIKTMIILWFGLTLATMNYAAILLPALALIVLSLVIRWVWDRLAAPQKTVLR